MNGVDENAIDEATRKQFERARKNGDRASLESFLSDTSQLQYLATLEELVHIELEYEWKSSESGDESGKRMGPLVEDYVARFPQLADANILQRLLRQEYSVRTKFGDGPTPESYVHRFPAVQNRIVLETELDDAWKRRRFAPGRLVGRYQLTEPYATGGFGVVWRAKDKVLGRQVAFKHLRDNLITDADLKNRFIREAKVTAQLEHPGIVPIYDLGGLEQKAPYYTMKLVRGRPLQESIQDLHQDTRRAGDLGRLRLLNALVSVARTIGYAHARGIVHRDLKPQNILLGDFGETVILDWGLARGLRDEQDSDAASRSGSPPTRTVDGQIQGTPAYMSPEQASGQRNIDERCDIFSMGVVLYQILTGELPFVGTNSDEVLAQVRIGSLKRPREVDPTIEPPLEAICLKSLQPAAEDRYQSAGELVQDIECYLADRPVNAWTEPVSVRLARWLRRHRTLSISTAAVALVSLIGLAIFSGVLGQKNSDLRTANISLDTRNEELRASIEREQDAMVRVKRNADDAREQAELALGTLNAVIFDLQEMLRDLPVPNERRQQLLKTSLERLSAVSTDFVSPGKARRHQLHNLIELAHVALEVGPVDDQTDAESVILNGDAIRRSAAASAESLFQKALYVAEDLQNREPDDHGTMMNLAYILEHLAMLNHALGREAKVDVTSNRAINVRESLLKANPGSREAQRGLVTSLTLYAKVFQDRDEHSSALRHLRRALKIANDLAGSGEAQARFELTLVQQQMGLSLLQVDQFDEASQQFVAAIEIATELHKDNADTELVSEDDLMMLRDLLAQARAGHLAFGDWDKLVAQPIESQPPLLEQRALRAANDGRVEAAIRAADHLVSLKVVSANQLYNAACVYGLCLRQDNEGNRADQVRKKAIASLARALAAGFDDRKLLESDPDLDTLRSLPEFKELLKAGD